MVMIVMVMTMIVGDTSSDNDDDYNGNIDVVNYSDDD